MNQIQRPSLFVAFRVAILIALSFTVGCAAAFAPTDKQTIDIREIRPGMKRVEVEKRLGRATLDVRPGLGSSAARRCEYRYFERIPLAESASSLDQVQNKLTGFRDHGVTIFFDGADRVISVHRERTAANHL